ncbi:MAG: efflux RND transporter periplasmic adaptor subunit [Bryobacterales bacterium]|nr:efflux RND transporter periplasmic adaptor subunit [Bryobacterales bacterium]
MESPDIKKQTSGIRTARAVSLLVALAAGAVLGAFLYSMFAGSASSSRTSGNVVVAESPQSAGAEAPSETVRISGGAQKDLGIAVEPAALRKLQVMLSATGVVSEDPSRVAHVRALARGLIENIFVRLGDRVPAGAPLVEYDNVELGLAIGDYQGARAELERSLTDLEVKRKVFERSREMLKVGAVAQTIHDLREAEVKDAEARVAGAQAMAAKIAAQIHRFGWTEADLAKLPAGRAGPGHTASHSILKAPFAGVVTSLHAVGSEAVEQGTELLAITDMSAVWVLADVYEKDLSQIRTGQSVRVRVASYPQAAFAGKITYVADIIDPKTRTAKVRCLAENASGLLKLEMFATVDIPVEQTAPILAIPSSAIQQIDGRPVVFVRTSDVEFQRREVQTGIEAQGFTAIRAGLTAGEPVVSRGSFLVKTEFLKHLIEGGDE